MSKEVKNLEKAEGIVDRFLASNVVATTKLVALTVRDLILIFVPFAVTTYLFHTQEDKLVLAIGVATGIYGFVNTAKLAYGYEKRSSKRR